MLQIINNAIIRINSIKSEAEITCNLRSTKRNILLEVICNGASKNVVKICRGSDSSGLENENNLLDYLEQSKRLTGDVSVPRVLDNGKLKNGKFLIFEYLKGEQINGSFFSNKSCTDRVLGFLTNLVGQDSKNFSLAELDKYINIIQSHNILGDKLENIKRTLGKFEGIKYPDTIVHGDLSYNNLLVNEDSIGVIDWEDGEITSYPLIDALDFVLYDIYRTNKNYIETFNILLGNSGKLHREFLTRYCSSTGITSNMIEMLLIIYILKKLSVLVRLESARAKVKIDEMLGLLDLVDDTNCQKLFYQK